MSTPVAALLSSHEEAAKFPIEMSPLAEPMLARSGRLPGEDGYAYELKWDGFRDRPAGLAQRLERGSGIRE